MENSCLKKYKPSSKNWVLASRRTGFRRNSALIPANAGLFHYAGNNPVRYIDPTGRDDLYYDENGNYLKSVKTKFTNVYLTKNNCNTLIGSQSYFDLITAALYGEGTENLDEMQAIGDAIMNRVEFMGTCARVEITMPRQVKGYNETSRAATSNGRTSNENSKLNTARNAAITTILGTSRGKSNGAYYWDGADIAITDRSNPLWNEHRDWGLHFSESGHDIYNIGDTTGGPYVNYWKYEDGRPPKLRGICNQKFDSTAAYGGTIFWKVNPTYKDIMGASDFSRKE